MHKKQEKAPVEWRFHIGVHKTATTHLQDILAANRDGLAADGFDYFPRELIRQSKLVPTINHNFWQTRLPYARRASLEELVMPLRSGPEKIIVSEENIIGNSVQLLRGLYPDVQSRLVPWSSIMDQRRTTVFVSLRNFADVLPSAYSQALRDGSIIPPFRDFLAFWLEKRPKWSEFISRVREAFRISRLRVWTFDEYSENQLRIASLLSGVANLNVIDVPIPRYTKTLSWEAISYIEKLDPRLPFLERRQRILSIASSTIESDPFSPLNKHERNELTDYYMRDLELVRSMGFD
jgi:hypothetical protein